LLTNIKSDFPVTWKERKTTRGAIATSSQPKNKQKLAKQITPTSHVVGAAATVRAGAWTPKTVIDTAADTIDVLRNLYIGNANLSSRPPFC